MAKKNKTSSSNKRKLVFLEKRHAAVEERKQTPILPTDHFILTCKTILWMKEERRNNVPL